jgi:aspartate/glutamate racemase
MTTVVAIYTGHGVVDALRALIKEYLPDVRLYNIIDDSLIQQVIQDGKVKESVALRLMQHYKMAVDLGADYILNTCSSVGEIASAARNIFETPILKIDEPMAKQAVQNFQKIAVLATLPTTLMPTINLVKSQAQILGKSVTVIDGLAKGAYEAGKAKNMEKFEKLILEAAVKVAEQADCIVLAQGTMAKMEEKLKEETGIPVLASPRLCIQEMKAMLAGS